MNNDNILVIKDLVVKFPVHGGVFLSKVADIKAVDGVSFEIKDGETLGLVGESGCGKSTVGKAIINVLKFNAPDVAVSGEVLLKTKDGYVDLVKLKRSEIRKYRGLVQMIFQDPYSSLNARMTVSQIVEEPLKYHTKMNKKERLERVTYILEKVGLQAEQMKRYPHEFSGGQRQRIGIARSLSTNPKLIIADEPVSSLDVSVQAQIINLFLDIRERFAISFLFISHDLSIVKFLSDEIMVMYRGRVLERASREDLFSNPLHPYTRMLIDSAHGETPERQEREAAGQGGCLFFDRCTDRRGKCGETQPQLRSEADHFVACHYVYPCGKRAL